VAHARHEIEDIRKRAVDQHDRQAGQFEAEYRQMEASDHYASAFLYGRKKIDDLLYPWLESFPKGAKVLDVGCGTGEQVRLIRERGYDVSGVEPAPAMRQRAIENNPGTQIVDGTITEIPFEDNAFDAVLAIEVLRYLHRDDIIKSYQEMLRVLKPSGQLFVTLVNMLATDGFVVFDKLKRAAYRFSGKKQPAHCEFVTPGRVRNELMGLGAEDIRLYGRLFGPIRISYKFDAGVGKSVARRLNGFDDVFSQMSWTIPFAGHLVAIATKPGANRQKPS
jgi:ubiquinone/menaquinone biosynthesis C-methylase UbiE